MLLSIPVNYMAQTPDQDLGFFVLLLISRPPLMTSSGVHEVLVLPLVGKHPQEHLVFSLIEAGKSAKRERKKT